MKRLPGFSPKFLLQLIICFWICLPAGNAWSKRIVVFTPTCENNTYWPEVFKILRAVAEDLHIKLDIYEFDVGDRLSKHTEGLRLNRSCRQFKGVLVKTH